MFVLQMQERSLCTPSSESLGSCSPADAAPPEYDSGKASSFLLQQQHPSFFDEQATLQLIIYSIAICMMFSIVKLLVFKNLTALFDAAICYGRSVSIIKLCKTMLTDLQMIFRRFQEYKQWIIFSFIQVHFYMKLITWIAFQICIN